jgi:hypothetical protein
MKKLQNLGKPLSKDEQKKIVGGTTTTCACANGTAFICVGNPISCTLDAAQVCGGGQFTCYYK